MIFYLLLCNILFIPLLYAKNITISEPDTTNKTVSDSHEKLPNKTKVTLYSEGSLLPDTSVLALPKDKHTILMSLDSETGKTKVKPVVARKGVVYTEENNDSQQKTPSISSGNSTVGLEIPETADVLKKLLYNTTNPVNIAKKNNTLLNKLTNSVKDGNKTEVHKKPTILSYDSVANMTVKPPPATLINNQILPKKELKVYAKNASSHPGMIMPLVITILLVPMFAVLGYMALRRGQEAWKNRHYKRMDFLLDGMYND